MGRRSPCQRECVGHMGGPTVLICHRESLDRNLSSLCACVEGGGQHVGRAGPWGHGTGNSGFAGQPSWVVPLFGAARLVGCSRRELSDYGRRVCKGDDVGLTQRRPRAVDFCDAAVCGVVDTWQGGACRHFTRWSRFQPVTLLLLPCRLGCVGQHAACPTARTCVKACPHRSSPAHTQHRPSPAAHPTL